MVILNIVLAAIVPLVEPKSEDSLLIRRIKQEFLGHLNDALTNPAVCEDCQEGLFIRVTPINFLFDGFFSKTMRALNYAIKKMILPDRNQVINMLDAFYKKFKLDISILPQEIALYASNGTVDDEYYTINNGRFDTNKLLHMEKFRGNTTLPEEWWPRGPPIPSAYEFGFNGICRELFGTDGKDFITPEHNHVL